MGRLLDALLRADRASGEPQDRPAASPSPVRLPPGESVADSTEEVPFIEVGPRKSMEASPSVLASAPALVSAMPRPEPPGSMAPPRSVQFRALPARGEQPSAFASSLIAYHAPEQRASQQYRVVLDAILRTLAVSQPAAVLLFTAPRPRTGTTTTLLNLAITAARKGQGRVLVVDANLRQPAVAERLGLSPAPGLREVLAGTAALDEVVQPTEQAHLFALTASSECGFQDNLPGKDIRPRFVAGTMRSLLRQLRQQFHLVLVDGPSWDGRPDGSLLGAACDAVLVVLSEQEAETPLTDTLLQRISQQGGRLAGCILVADSALPS